MGEQRLLPETMPREMLLHILDDIRAKVAAGDSFEGSIEYLIPEADGAPAGSFDVRASYRIGNLHGQGGMRMIGRWAEVPEVTVICPCGTNRLHCHCEAAPQAHPQHEH